MVGFWQHSFQIMFDSSESALPLIVGAKTEQATYEVFFFKPRHLYFPMAIT